MPDLLLVASDERLVSVSLDLRVTVRDRVRVDSCDEFGCEVELPTRALRSTERVVEVRVVTRPSFDTSGVRVAVRMVEVRPVVDAPSREMTVRDVVPSVVRRRLVRSIVVRVVGSVLVRVERLTVAGPDGVITRRGESCTTLRRPIERRASL